MSGVNTSSQVLTIGGLPVTNMTLTQAGGVKYTDAILNKYSLGFATMILTENIAGGAGSIDVFAEYSNDGITFYRPYLSDNDDVVSGMAGALTAEGDIVSALQNVVRFIVFVPRLAKYIRFGVLPNANSQVSLEYAFQEQV